MTKPITPSQLTLSGTLNANSNTNTKAEVIVKEFPTISVDSSTDIVAILSFLITALVVVGTTWLTIRNYQKTIDLQDRIANKTHELEATRTRVEIVSKNRQEWINTLRDDLAEFISVMLSVVELHELRVAMERDLATLGNKEHVDGLLTWNYQLHETRTKAVRLKAKIKLLSNPNEDDFVSMLKTIEEVHKAVNAKKKNIGSEIDALVEISQKILKNEWERVKSIQ